MLGPVPFLSFNHVANSCGKMTMSLFVPGFYNTQHARSPHERTSQWEHSGTSLDFLPSSLESQWLADGMIDGLLLANRRCDHSACRQTETCWWWLFCVNVLEDVSCFGSFPQSHESHGVEAQGEVIAQFSTLSCTTTALSYGTYGQKYVDRLQSSCYNIVNTTSSFSRILVPCTKSQK